jgi:hypothetical protein
MSSCQGKKKYEGDGGRRMMAKRRNGFMVKVYVMAF